MANVKPEYYPTVDPVIEASWNGSHAEVYNLDALIAEDTPGSALMLLDTDFNLPIKQLVIAANRSKLPSGEMSTSFSAELDIHQLEDGDWQTLLDKMHSPESRFDEFNLNDANDASGAMLIEDEAQPGKYNLFADGKVQVQVEVNQFLPHAVIRTLPDKWLDGDEIAGQTENQLLYFLASVMRTVDYIAAAKKTSPQLNRLNHEYILGLENIKDEDSAVSILPAVARLAIEAPTYPWDDSEELGEAKLMLKDVGGLKDVKAHLEELVLAHKYPEIMQKWGASKPNSVLLHGPPGTGKTMLISALANELDAKLMTVRGSDIIDKWVGNSEKNLNSVFDSAEDADGKVVLFFDEIETIIQADAKSERSSVVGAFKIRAAELAKSPNVLLAAATNHFDELGQDIVRSGRFDLKLAVPLPDTSSRVDIIASLVDLGADLDSSLSAWDVAHASKHSVETFRPFVSDINLPAIAEISDGFSGADLAELFRCLRMQKAMQEASGRAATPIDSDDIKREIVAMKQRGQVS